MHTYKWLAIETSTDMLSLAIASTQGDKSQVWAHTSQGGAKSSQLVLPEIVRLMDEAQMRFADLTAVVFGKGPGSFTGLRTACSVAQGLAFGAGVPVLPIDTLLAVAEDARYQNMQQKQQQTQQQPEQIPQQTQRFFVAMDARMDQVYTAAYEWRSEWQCVQESSVNSPENISVPTEWKDLAFTTVGNAWDAFAARSPAGLSGQHMHAMPTALALLRLSPVAFGQGLSVPPEDALPLYIRDKVAQTTQERAQLKLATTIST
ncbi:MAG: tRNA (adenosine(37)-N6)-threonylcarbamoyltransferase complex dimerization subunit type 1 TsaB [Burkholderiales bacterium]|nr:tRNA (adenosine(37)-N6)-threonylcarbamoyltransferase complex dimerization subunit type 1 TsaB [Burkholderiales bacterium]